MKNEYGYDENTSLKALLWLLALVAFAALLGLGALIASQMGTL